jgi:Zn-dependent protease with chaperone function
MADQACARRGSTLLLALLVLEGYAYLFGTILLFACVAAFFAWGVLARHPAVGLLAVFIGLPTALLTGSAMRALFFRIPMPEGQEIRAADAPDFIAMVEEVRRALRAPKVHRIQVAAAFNASAVQYPRLVLFCPRNVLVIGYPLLIALAPEQLRTVLAHELAHLAHSHGTVSGWAYRTRLSWTRLSAALNQRGVLPVFVRWILEGYVPRLERGSAAIARAQEQLADRHAAALAGCRLAADTLVAMELGQSWIADRFWPALHQRVELEAEPPRPFAEMRGEYLATAQDHATPELLARLLDDETRGDDTHPCLGDRLRAAGAEPRIPEPAAMAAGEILLGPFLAELADGLDRDWQQRQGTGWRQRHARASRALGRLGALAAKPSLTPEEEFERGCLLEELGRQDEALAAYSAAHAAEGGHARAALAAGELLLWRGDARGAALLERAMAIDPDLAAEAAEPLAEHHEAEGRFLEAERLRAVARRAATHSAIRQAERKTVTAFDQLEPHGLCEDALRPLLSALRKDAGILRAFLTRKRLRHSQGSLFVLGLIAPNAPAFEPTEFLADETCLVLLDRSQKALESALMAIPGAEIYAR